jgi:hypothetical protein
MLRRDALFDPNTLYYEESLTSHSILTREEKSEERMLKGGPPTLWELIMPEYDLSRYCKWSRDSAGSYGDDDDDCDYHPNKIWFMGIKV